MSEKACFDCAEAFRRLDDFLDRELNAGEAELVREHLEMCKTCAEEFKFEGVILVSLREKLSHIDVPCDLIDRLKAVLDKA